MCFYGRNFVFQFLELTALPTEFLFDGGGRFQVPNLREVGQANAGSELDVTRVLLLLADGVEERGFSRSVVADDADAVAVVDLDVDVLQHVHGTKGAVHRFYVDEFTCHGAPSIGGPPLTVDKSRSLRRRERAGPTRPSFLPAGDGFLR